MHVDICYVNSQKYRIYNIYISSHQSYVHQCHPHYTEPCKLEITVTTPTSIQEMSGSIVNVGVCRCVSVSSAGTVIHRSIRLIFVITFCSSIDIDKSHNFPLTQIFSFIATQLRV